MAGGDFMFNFIKIINGLFFDSSDVVIGNSINIGGLVWLFRYLSR